MCAPGAAVGMMQVISTARPPSWASVPAGALQLYPTAATERELVRYVETDAPAASQGQTGCQGRAGAEGCKSITDATKLRSL